tara:strand:- start:258 stop:833 length:576 start_codon:yes stop_codon:yes gene_type:complete
MTERARYSIHGIPNDLTTSDRINIRRLKVEQDDTNYALGTQFRISIPLTVDDGAPVVLKFESPIDFELIEQSLETHQSGITFEAYRSTQGTEIGVYNTAVPVYKNNIQSTVMGYTQQVTVTTGGGFTPDVGQTAVETLNALSASATAQRSTVFAGASGKRGLAAGIYYLSFSKLSGSGTALGVYSLIFNEN